MFEDFNIGRVQKEKKLNKTVSVRVTEEEYEWLKRDNISPTKLFRYCLMKISEDWNKEHKNSQKKETKKN